VALDLLSKKGPLTTKRWIKENKRFYYLRYMHMSTYDHTIKSASFIDADAYCAAERQQKRESPVPHIN